MSSSTGEISSYEAMQTLLLDSSMSDVKLQCVDGALVHANRAILGSRSRVFRALLFGGFAEASASVVKIDYKEVTVRALLAYIYTDVIPDGDCEDHQFVGIIFSLWKAGQFFEFPALCTKIQQMISKSLQKQPSLACFLLDFCQETPAFELEQMALRFIGSNFEAAVTDEVVSSMSLRVLERIIKFRMIQTEEFNLFGLIFRWSLIKDDTPASKGNARIELSSELAQHIFLERISPTDLSSTVAASGLVPQKRLLHAFQNQAVKAQSQHGASFKRARFSLPVWERSGELELTGDSWLITSRLRCRPMTTGVHKWKIQVMNHNADICLMIARCFEGNAAKEEQQYLRYWSNGKSYKRDKKYAQGLPTFGAGSIVAFTLNLDIDGGELKASVDDQPEFVLFSGIQSKTIPGAHFLPRASVKVFSRIRLLEFESPVESHAEN